MNHRVRCGRLQVSVTTPDGKHGVRVSLESANTQNEGRVYLVAFIDRGHVSRPARCTPHHDDDPAPLETLFRTISGPLRRNSANV